MRKFMLVFLSTVSAAVLLGACTSTVSWHSQEYAQYSPLRNIVVFVKNRNPFIAKAAQLEMIRELQEAAPATHITPAYKVFGETNDITTLPFDKVISVLAQQGYDGLLMAGITNAQTSKEKLIASLEKKDEVSWRGWRGWGGVDWGDWGLADIAPGDNYTTIYFVQGVLYATDLLPVQVRAATVPDTEDVGRLQQELLQQIESYTAIAVPGELGIAPTLDYQSEAGELVMEDQAVVDIEGDQIAVDIEGDQIAVDIEEDQVAVDIEEDQAAVEEQTERPRTGAGSFFHSVWEVLTHFGRTGPTVVGQAEVDGEAEAIEDGIDELVDEVTDAEPVVEEPVVEEPVVEIEPGFANEYVVLGNTSRIVWAAQSELFDPADTEGTIYDMMDLVSSNLSEAGVLAK